MTMHSWGTLAAVIALAGSLCAAPHRSSWDLRNSSWLKLVGSEAGAPPNAHPIAVAPEALKGILLSVVLEVQGEREPLFAPDEAVRILGPMVEALSVAEPGEDLVFFSTNRRGKGFMAPELTITGRVFVQGGRVNLIVRETRLDYVGPMRANVGPPTPSNGSRKTAGPAVLAAKGGQNLRPDWLAFSLEAPPAIQAQAAVPPTPGSPAEERLRTLKRLREENLITEDEYQSKRKEVLKNL